MVTLKDMNSGLLVRVANLESKIEDQEAYSRRDCCVFSGNLPEESTSENCVEIVKKLAREAFNTEILDSDISTAHRLGKRQLMVAATGPGKPRNIIVKFTRRNIKVSLLSEAIKKNKVDRRAGRPRSEAVFVAESLTPVRNKISWFLRKAMKTSTATGLKSVTSRDGNVIAFTATSDGTRDLRHVLNSSVQLESFCIDHIKVPIELFLESFSRS